MKKIISFMIISSIILGCNLSCYATEFDSIIISDFNKSILDNRILIDDRDVLTEKLDECTLADKKSSVISETNRDSFIDKKKHELKNNRVYSKKSRKALKNLNKDNLIERKKNRRFSKKFFVVSMKIFAEILITAGAFGGIYYLGTNIGYEKGNADGYKKGKLDGYNEALNDVNAGIINTFFEPINIETNIIDLYSENKSNAGTYIIKTPIANIMDKLASLFASQNFVCNNKINNLEKENEKKITKLNYDYEKNVELLKHKMNNYCNTQMEIQNQKFNEYKELLVKSWQDKIKEIENLKDKQCREITDAKADEMKDICNDKISRQNERHNQDVSLLTKSWQDKIKEIENLKDEQCREITDAKVDEMKDICNDKISRQNERHNQDVKSLNVVWQTKLCEIESEVRAKCKAEKEEMIRNHKKELKSKTEKLTNTYKKRIKEENENCEKDKKEIKKEHNTFRKLQDKLSQDKCDRKLEKAFKKGEENRNKICQIEKNDIMKDCNWFKKLQNSLNQNECSAKLYIAYNEGYKRCKNEIKINCGINDVIEDFEKSLNM